jgi:hypothetical protein
MNRSAAMIRFDTEMMKSFWQRIRDYLFGRPAPVRVRALRRPR